MSDELFRRLLLLDAEFRALTGREALGHTAQPVKGQWRIAFADGVVVRSPGTAVEYMTELLTLAVSDPRSLPYPLDQELSPGQDRRDDLAWVTQRLVPADLQGRSPMDEFRAWRENLPKDGWE